MVDPAPQKYLSYSAILCLAANTMNGPGITTLPDVAADAGLSLYVILIALSVCMAAFVCRRMVYAMWSTLDLHENDDGKKDNEDNVAIITNQGKATQPLLENTSIVGQSREAYGKKASVYVAFTMVASALCLGLAQMMLCAAILDGMFVAVGGKSCALGWPSADDESASWIHCTTHSSMKPYAGSGAPMSLISIGWVISATLSVALGTVDLDDMMGVQYLLFGCLVVSAIRFSVVLKRMANGLGGEDLGTDVDVIAVGSAPLSWFVGPNPFQTVGPIVFNFAFVVTSPPSSAMAKKESIAYKALGMSCVIMGALYICVGLCGASVSNAVRHGLVEGADDSNLLSLILLSGDGGPSVFDLCMIALFGFSTIASVPVYCLLAKETLIYDAGVPPLPSFILSNVVPWILVALTYNAAFFKAFVNWSGLIVLGYANFSLPLSLDLKLMKVRSAISKRIQLEGERINTTTKGVFILVTASITLVIIVSITDSLTELMYGYTAQPIQL